MRSPLQLLQVQMLAATCWAWAEHSGAKTAAATAEFARKYSDVETALKHISDKINDKLFKKSDEKRKPRTQSMSAIEDEMTAYKSAGEKGVKVPPAGLFHLEQGSKKTVTKSKATGANTTPLLKEERENMWEARILDFN